MRTADGRLAVIDFGATKVTDRREMPATIELLEAGAARDAEAVRRLLHRFGWMRDPERVDAESAARVDVGAVELVPDRRAAVRVDRARVARALDADLDPRLALGLTRKLVFPPDQIQFQRMEKSVLAVLGQLDVERNWLAIAREWWHGAPPATPLGEAEREFWPDSPNPRN